MEDKLPDVLKKVRDINRRSADASTLAELRPKTGVDKTYLVLSLAEGWIPRASHCLSHRSSYRHFRIRFHLQGVAGFPASADPDASQEERQTDSPILDVDETFEQWLGIANAFTQGRSRQIWTLVTDLTDIDLALKDSPVSIVNSFSVVIQAFLLNNYTAAGALSELNGLSEEMNPFCPILRYHHLHSPLLYPLDLRRHQILNIHLDAFKLRLHHLLINLPNHRQGTGRSGNILFPQYLPMKDLQLQLLIRVIAQHPHEFTRRQAGNRRLVNRRLPL